MAKILYLHEGEADNTARIAVDGKYIDSVNFVGFVDSNIHAIQWDGKSGEIEYKDNTPNKTISDISSYGFEKKFTDDAVMRDLRELRKLLNKVDDPETRIEIIKKIEIITSMYN